MEKSKLDFKAGNPGAVQYGNFINYYQFHPPENRLKLVPVDIWSDPFYGLDLGCNAGDLTLSIYDLIKQKVETCNIFGIDIDQNLVDRAAEKIPNEDINFSCVNFMEESERALIQAYLKDRNLLKFSTVFCFSITMWIHLNYGDEGLKTFLREICALGELIVIEPQPWKCYRAAVKRMRLSNCDFPLFGGLKIRQTVEDEIEHYLVDECGASKMYESPRTDWGRKLLVFKCAIT